MTIANSLPANWSQFNPADKIAFFNQNQITPTQLMSEGVPVSDIQWMQQNGYTVGNTSINDVINAIQGASTGTMAQKAQTYNALQNQGFSDASINDLITQAVGQQSKTDMDYLKTLANIQDISTGTMQDKQAYANQLLSKGMTQSDVVNAISNAVGQQSTQDTNALFSQPALRSLFPSFAMSKQLAAQQIANQPTTQQIVNLIQSSMPKNTITAESFTPAK
jgi:hypothetical protein